MLKSEISYVGCDNHSPSLPLSFIPLLSSFLPSFLPSKWPSLSLPARPCTPWSPRCVLYLRMGPYTVFAARREARIEFFVGGPCGCGTSVLSAFQDGDTLVVQDKVLGLRFHKGNLVATGIRKVVAKTQNGSSQPIKATQRFGLPFWVAFTGPRTCREKARREDRVFFRLLTSFFICFFPVAITTFPGSRATPGTPAPRRSPCPAPPS